ncbi:peptide ABC transporter substrate-binding protein (plasmid) [Deinococcus aetherius]|uniref:Peptide ABC transporter substrate-binding protein n=1 Tax=Deinococcus aetherius TaxID=200252 RepID=A0ABN6RJP1_9DEIO|nr:ABC transporter substrate-binding protein [Deinococcus aetherius]BDP43546.1 peptide ABC transporter substrate-binding protein [Deinococcus aetherius]
MKHGTKTLLALITAALSTAALAQPKTTFSIANTATWGSKNYNPFTPAASHLPPTLSAIHETLFYVNALDGKVTPVLGTKYTWSPDNKTLTISTRPGVKWSDGKAFSANDVAYTFNLIKANPALDLTGIWKNGVASVKATNPNTVAITFSKVNTPLFYYVAHLPIVPQHVWSTVKDPLTYTNENPVGTGPFVAEAYSQQAIRVLKNPNYWMKGQPYVDAVAWYSSTGNDASLLKMLKGETDYGYIAIPNPKTDYQAKGPNFQYWWPVNNVNALYFNTTKAPFNDPAFRRAIASAINTKDVAQKAYAGVVPAADPTAIIPSQQKAWKPATAASLAPRFDPAAADKALTAAGYRKNAQGQRLGKDGKPLPTLKILVGAGWTDFITMGQVIGNNLKPLGINTSIDQQVFSSYSGSFQTANFDMGVSWGWGSGPTPYNLYYQSFAPEFSAPVGKTAASNLAHYTNPALTKAIAAFSTTSSVAAQKQATSTMVTTVLRDMPWVPLTARVGFNVYNTTRFTGFPDDDNAYNDASAPDTVGARLMFLNVKPK